METACLPTRQRSDIPGREAWTLETFLLSYVERRLGSEKQNKNQPVIVDLTVYLEHKNCDSLVKWSSNGHPTVILFIHLLWFSTSLALVQLNGSPVRQHTIELSSPVEGN